MDTLHKHNYSIEEAMCSLVPSSGPVLCRDEMEEWSASEANLFEEALDKYGKDFNDIRTDFVSRDRTSDKWRDRRETGHEHMITNDPLITSVALEDAEEHCGVLLHVEDDRSVRAAEASEGCGGRVQAEASLHSQLHQAQCECRGHGQHEGRIRWPGWWWWSEW